MAEAQAYEQDHPDLPPPGSRWGSGAGSVLPYLTKSLQARPAHGAETREANASGEGQARTEHTVARPAA